jgi:hypothetical protein
MIPDTTTRLDKIMVDEAIMRESPGFQAVWERNVSVEDLSKRRQMQRFDIINAEFLPAQSIICLIFFSALLYRCRGNRWIPNNTKVALRLYHIRFSRFPQSLIYVLSIFINLRFRTFILFYHHQIE